MNKATRIFKIVRRTPKLQKIVIAVHYLWPEHRRRFATTVGVRVSRVEAFTVTKTGYSLANSRALNLLCLTPGMLRKH